MVYVWVDVVVDAIVVLLGVVFDVVVVSSCGADSAVSYDGFVEAHIFGSHRG